MRALPTEKKGLPSQNKLMKPFLQPPTLKNIDLLQSLQSLGHLQKKHMPRLQLPKVLQNSYFSNSQSSISHRQAYDSFVRPQIPHQRGWKINQQEQSNDYGEVQHKEHKEEIGQQSMIMEQIDYRSDGRGLENTPQWENQKQSSSGGTKHQLHYYTKESAEHNSAKFPFFIAKKSIEPLQFDDQVAAQPLLLKESPKIKYISQPPQPTGNFQSISLFIPYKANDFSSPSNNKQSINEIVKSPSIVDFLVQSNSKEKKFQETLPKIEQNIKDSIVNKNNNNFHKEVEERSCQTNLKGQQLQQNLTKITQQNARLKQNVSSLSSQIQNHIQTIIRLKRIEQQSDKLTIKVKQLENSLKMKNDAIKDQQQVNRSLQIKLSKLQNSTTTLCPSEQLSPTFNNPNSSVQWLIKSKTYSDREEINQHEKCKKQIEDLQEKLFDTSQTVAKVKQLLYEKDKQISSLQENLSEMWKAYKILQNKSNQDEKQWRQAYLKLKNREQQVNKLFQAIGKQWRAIQYANQSRDQLTTSLSPHNSPRKTIQTSQNYFKKPSIHQTDQKTYEGRPSLTKLSQKHSIPAFNISQYNALASHTGPSLANKYDFTQNSSPFKLRNNKQVYNDFKKAGLNFDDQPQQRRRRMSHFPSQNEPQFSQISFQIQKLRKQISKELHSCY